MAHKQSVLKERRIPPDSLACFAVAECQDWRWGSVPRQRLGVSAGKDSAGPVLRSQGTLGQARLSRGRATGIRMSTFLRSLRPGPAAASWSGPGSVPPIYTKGDTLYYTDVVAGAPRDWSCARCRFVEAQEGSGEVKRSECPNEAPHTSPG